MWDIPLAETCVGLMCNVTKICGTEFLEIVKFGIANKVINMVRKLLWYTKENM